MKRTLTALVLLITLLFPAAVMSQTLSIHFNDGTVQDYECATIDSMVLTPAAVQSPVFDINVAEVKASRAHIIVTCPDPTVRYYFDLCTQTAYDSNNGDIAKIVNKIIADAQEMYPQLTLDQILKAMLETGQTDDVIRQLPASTDMVVYAIAVDETGKCYGQPTLARFRTLEAGDPADCTFQISVSEVKSTECTVNIVPSDESVKYWYGICKRSEYPGDVAMMLTMKSAFDQAASENGLSVEDLIQRVAYMDEVNQAESGLQNSTDYYVFAFALNNDGSNAGPLTKIQFSTTDYDLSDAAISLSYRYFNGDELYNSNPETYAKYKGGVLVQYMVTPNESAAHWVVALGVGDMTDLTVYPDESTKNAILQMGNIDAETKDLVAKWGEATFVYFAADKMGVDGPLKRLKFDITPEGASPISQLVINPLNIKAAKKAMETLPAKMSKINTRLSEGRGLNYRSLAD